tara:strand:+ start:1276 stop:1626 length:351 start_codon:yes stop_codon:yes gene_type:complete
MANAFKNVTVRATSLAADTDIAIGSAVASGATHTIIGMSISNITSGVITTSVKLTNSSTETFIVKDAPIPAGGSLLVAGGDQKIVLWYTGGNGDLIKVQSNTANSMNIILSYLEST